MNSRTGKFLCVIPPKTLSINHDTGEAHQQSEQHVREALEAIEFSNKSTSELNGGGIAIGVGPNVQAFTDNEIIVSFVGHLTNVDYLAWRLFSPEGRRGDDLEKRAHADPLEAAHTLVGGRCYEAELVCHVYKTFGTHCLPKLRGKFAFTCYDARTVRVPGGSKVELPCCRRGSGD